MNAELRSGSDFIANGGQFCLRSYSLIDEIFWKHEERNFPRREAAKLSYKHPFSLLSWEKIN